MLRVPGRGLVLGSVFVLGPGLIIQVLCNSLSLPPSGLKLILKWIRMLSFYVDVNNAFCSSFAACLSF